MEKVIFTKIFDTGRKTKDDNHVIEIETKDGRNGSAFDSSFLGLELNKEYDVFIKDAPEYKGEKRYYFFTEEPAKKNKSYSKDWTFEKRKTSLENAINSIKLTGKEVTTENIIALSDKYFEYLNKK